VTAAKKRNDRAGRSKAVPADPKVRPKTARAERRGRPKRSEELDARNRIMNAAERLFAKKGMHGTPLREIARDAGLNPNLVSYYFPTKEHLYRELVNTRAQWLNDRREVLLTAAEEACAPGQPSVEAIMRCFVRPVTELRAEDPEAWGRFYDLLSRESGSELWNEVVSRTLGPIMRRFAIALHRVLPSAQRRDILFLIELALHATIMISPSHARSILDDSTRADWSDDELEERIVRSMTAAAGDLLRQN
jgi:AcrR family transcriptional regulator